MELYETRQGPTPSALSRGVGLPIAAVCGFVAMVSTSGVSGSLRGLWFWIVAVTVLILEALGTAIHHRERLRNGFERQSNPAAPKAVRDDFYFEAELRFRSDRRKKLLAMREENLRFPLHGEADMGATPESGPDGRG